MTQLEKIRSNTAGRTYEEIRPVKRKNAVLIPLVEKQGEWSILVEVRQTGIRQGGEICFPGGRIEEHETAEEAAVRETSEELLISPQKIEVIAPMHTMAGPGGAQIRTLCGCGSRSFSITPLQSAAQACGMRIARELRFRRPLISSP